MATNAPEIVDKVFKVTKIVYYKESANWGVLGTTPEDDLGKYSSTLINRWGSVTITGNFPSLYEGVRVKVTGNIADSNYGKQIQILKITALANTKSEEGIVNWLAKTHIQGISVRNAKKIYKAFGKDAIKVVLHSPDKLRGIKGIGQKTFEKVKASAAAYVKNEPYYTYCSNIGIPQRVQELILLELKDKALVTLQNDPFHVLDVTSTIPFKELDKTYLSNGGDPQGFNRLSRAFLYTLERKAVLEGSTGCKESTLEKEFYKLLDLSYSTEAFCRVGRALADTGKIYAEVGAFCGSGTAIIYDKEFVGIEKKIATKVKFLNEYGVLEPVKQDVLEEEIVNFPFTLNKQQETAVREAVCRSVAVITGPAGCGKSSITKAVARTFRGSGFPVHLLSPTAKACRRLEECVGEGFKASTIHKFLGLRENSDAINTMPYEPNAVVIIDEASMLDIKLFNMILLKATPSTRILLVGDNNQLPSVQAGNVLGDLIDSGVIYVASLTDIMRQKEDSNIIKFCSMINEGEVFDPIEEHDFHYEEFGTAQELVAMFMPTYLKEVVEHSLQEVQVIAPYKAGEIGMNNLNKMVQEEYNSDSEEIIEPYRVGDKVRHTVNNYDLEVFNGDTGVITGRPQHNLSFLEEEEDDTDEFLVSYGDRSVTYNNTLAKDLILAYASTVHASQGSEYKVVFVILDDTSVNDFLLIRRLLYTAVSRGKKKVYILTKPYLVDKCISNGSYKPRITKLKEFMQEKIEVDYNYA